VCSTVHLDLTMNKRARTDHCAAALILLLGLMVLHIIGNASLHPAQKPFPEKAQVFVEVAGNVKNPGVYGFHQKPHLKELARKAGFTIQVSNKANFPDLRFWSGSQVEVLRKSPRTGVHVSEMTAFYKMTLGIPISINHESADGLTSLPGIGPRLAEAIVTERVSRNGFSGTEDLLSVPGINQRLYRKIRPYLKP